MTGDSRPTLILSGTTILSIVLLLVFMAIAIAPVKISGEAHFSGSFGGIINSPEILTIGELNPTHNIINQTINNASGRMDVVFDLDVPTWVALSWMGRK